MKKTRTTITKKRKKQLTKRKHYKKYLMILVTLGVLVFLFYRGDILLNSVSFSPLNKIKQAQADGIELRNYACDSLEDDSKIGPHNAYVVPSKTTSEAYKNNLVGGNQVVNNKLNVAPSTTNPTGFEKTQNQDPNSSLERIIDKDGRPFLRSTVRQHDSQTGSVAWLMQPVAIKNTVYYYSLEYKSTSKTLMELVVADVQGKEHSKKIGEIDSSDDWTKVEGHFSNYDGTYNTIKIVARPSEVGTTDIRDLNISELRDTRPQTGIVTITFDDGWASIYKNGLPLFKKYDISTTQFVISGHSLKRADRYMTPEQLSKMQREGHEISSHSLKHCNLSTLKQTDLSYDLTTSKSLLQDKKLDAQGIAYPYGSHNAQVNANVQNLYSYARTSDEGYNDSFVDHYLIKIQSVDSGTTIEEVKSWVEYAKHNRLWLVLVYHQVGETGSYNVTIDQLENDLRAIKESGLPVKTVQDSLALLDK